MIIGLGSDLCNIVRIQVSLNHFGARLTNRGYTETECATAHLSLSTKAGSYIKHITAKKALLFATACALLLTVSTWPNVARAGSIAMPDEVTTRLVAKQKEMLAGVVASTGCHTIAGPDEIVVCGRGINQRIRSIAPPESGGPPQVKLVAPPNGSVGVGATAAVCFLQKCPKKFVLIDLSSIPEAPEGSDADLISRGLMSDH
jgi:phosphopantetheinyl transferase (holo-ACP synthase)